MGEIFFYWLTKGRGTSDQSYLLDADSFWHSPTAWSFDKSGHTPDFMPKLRDERRLDVPWPVQITTLLDPSENTETHQSTTFQLQTKSASPGFGDEASDLYGDEIGANGCVQPASATVLKPTGSQTIAMGECGEVCTIPSDQESSQSFTPDRACHEGFEKHCTCISCLKIGSDLTGPKKRMCHLPGCNSYLSVWEAYWHEQRHYIQNGKYTCLEQGCQAVTTEFYELKRHYKKHCTSPDKEQFPCPVLWCKYSGNNGFLRKDKLKSHYRNIHEGKPGPLKAGRVIKPRVSSVGNGSGKQKE